MGIDDEFVSVRAEMATAAKSISGGALVRGSGV